MVPRPTRPAPCAPSDPTDLPFASVHDYQLSVGLQAVDRRFGFTALRISHTEISARH